MKNLKKFAALLLAGAMALLMLTACGGGGSVNNPEEQKVLNQISNQKGVQSPGVWLQSCPPGLFCAGWQGGGRAHQIRAAPAGITSVSLLPPGLTALRQ